MKNITLILIFILGVSLSATVGQSITSNFTTVQSTAISNGDTLTNGWQTDFSYLLYGNTIFLIEDGTSKKYLVLDCIVITGGLIFILDTGIITLYHEDGLDNSLDVLIYHWSYEVNGSKVQIINRYSK